MDDIADIYPDELRSDRRGACQIVADRGPDFLGKQKNTRLANHHAQDVVVLQKLAKSNTEGPRPPDHATNLAIGAITPKTSENTTFLMA